MSLRVHALEYAERGWPVFPVGRDKLPRIPAWQKRASTDPMQVWTWWERWPRASIGCVTGRLFDVVDLDGPAARAHFEQVAMEAGHAFGGPISRTGRPEGGWQLFYAPTGHGNRRPSLQGVDFRGRGGFVVLPPSVHASGATYTWLREPASEFPELPEALRARLWPKPAAPRLHRPPPRVSSEDHTERWAWTALDGIKADWAATKAGEGKRNDSLNRLSFRAGQLAHVLGEGAVYTHLQAMAAAYIADKGERRTLATIQSGMRAGMAQPRFPITGGATTT